ncbi:MAG: DUF6174 domain-containing protein [Balneolales bacterium]
MIKNLFLIAFILGFYSCNENELFRSAAIDDDYSSITDPKERWEAYDLKSYSIEQTWSCECLPPSSGHSYIINNEVVMIEYNLSKNSAFGRKQDEIYSYAINKAITVEEAFDIIEKNQSAHRIDVEYDSRYGYPTSIFIDIDPSIADEEIIRNFGNLKRIFN